MARPLTLDDFQTQPEFAGDADAKDRVWTAVKDVVTTLTLAHYREVAKRTTFAVAEVITQEGRGETWIAGAGDRKDVPPRFRTKAMQVKQNIDPQGGKAHHAEAKLIRQAAHEGATIRAMGATREMCPVCQQAAERARVLDTIVTPLEKTAS